MKSIQENMMEPLPN